MKIDSSTFFITGGASGLGEAVARHLHSLGANVVIADRNEDAGNSVASSLGERALFLSVDVTSEDSVKKAIDTTVNRFSALDGVVNCAGVAAAMQVISKKGEIFPLDMFNTVLNINLSGTFNVLRLAAKQMSLQPENEDGERGVIINTASVAAFDGQQGQAAYSASKAGVVGMTLPIARELCRYGIRIATIAPGVFDTPMMAALPSRAREAIARTVPFPPRLGDPHQFAMLTESIITNIMLNGCTIRLDGALRLARL